MKVRMCVTLIAAVLFVPLGAMAQEDDDAAAKVAAGGQPKLAIELGAPVRDDAIL